MTYIPLIHSLSHIDYHEDDEWMINIDTHSIQNYKWDNTILASKYRVCILSSKEILQKLNVQSEQQTYCSKYCKTLLSKQLQY